MSITYQEPPLDAKGLAAREGLLWCGQKYGNNSGQTWNPHVPYAVGLSETPPALRIELRDTPNDHGLTDPSTKRRAEIGTALHYNNGVDYWDAYMFRATAQNINPGLNVRLSQPFHWPSGASPAVGHTLAATKGGELEFRVTLKNDNTGNVIKARAPLVNGSINDVVMEAKMGVNGFVRLSLNGKQILNFTGFVGSAKENGYSRRRGNYGTLKGASIITEYQHDAPMLCTTSLADRITNPPAWVE